MRLSIYLHERDESGYSFAKRTGLMQSQVWRLLNNGDVCGLAWAKVMAFTRGKVTPLDHFPVEVPALKVGRRAARG